MIRLTLPICALMLTACSASDVEKVTKSFEKSFKEIAIPTKPTAKRSTPTRAQQKPTSAIAVANSAGSDCAGVTVHKAYVDQHPFYHAGRVVTTIPVYRVVISNKGKRKKAIFDVSYKVDVGNAKYGTKQPTRFGTKELSPKTLRANISQEHLSLGNARDHRGTFTKVELVECQ